MSNNGLNIKDDAKPTSGKTNNHQVAQDGRDCVEAELSKNGVRTMTVVDKRKTYLQASNSDRSCTIRLRVKTKRGSGNWHSSTNEAEAIEILPNPKDEQLFWIFVDLGDYITEPRYWIVPDVWMRNDIYEAHQEYLSKHDGRRAENNDSTHHSIEERRLDEWRNKWEILDIFE